MTEIMYASILGHDLICDLLEVKIEPLRLEMVTDFVYEDQIILLLGVMTAYTWAGWKSLLPFISVAVTTVGYWTNNAQKIRLSQLIGSPCTLAYDLIVRTWGGALSEAIAIVSILFSIYRFGWRNLNVQS